MGSIRFASITFVIVIFFTGTLLVPQLTLEEKQTKTLDALLVSPASTAQVVLGKAAAGCFYCMVVSAVVLAFNSNLIVHWGLILLAFFCGTLLSVGIGLAMGIFLEVKAQITTWTLILAQPLIAPVFLSIMDPILPEKVRFIFSWIPTGALVILFRHTLSTGAATATTWRHFTLVLISATIVLAAVAWKVRRTVQ
jgi:ABC-2 type transport system permease protein